MRLVDDLLTSVHCRMPGSSPIYETILRHVVTEYKNKPRETQAIIFAVSYLMYSRKKKLTVNSMIQEGTTKLDQSTWNTMAATARSNIESDCTNAFELFQELSAETLENALSKVNTSISTSLSPLEKNIAACLAIISSVRGDLAPKSTPILSRKTLSNVSSFLFLDSFKHLIILLMVIFFWAVGFLYVIDNYIPPVRKAIGDFFTEERNRYFPQTPRRVPRRPLQPVQPSGESPP